ncbi:Htur_1727 family rSAM-partnered candidate RiPP [Halobellus inordinatus]|uniref:Htur_1727 family rSAM-partnered candidate RiPP n=1 Tax=Halobellus inordinatus TaxID=1126236 RepID=UPI00210B99B4
MTDSTEMRVTEPRSDATPGWEVFLRSEESEPLQHVGSVTAPSEAVAREQATSLFEWTAHTLWLCRADDVARFTNRDLGETHVDDAPPEASVPNASTPDTGADVPGGASQ